MNPPLVYIAGPYSSLTRAGVERNIYHATLAAIEVAKTGAMPVCPHAMTSHPSFEMVQPYPFWVVGTLALCRVCDAILMIPGWENSKGAQGELNAMHDMGKPAFYDVDEVSRWVKARAA